MYAKRSLRTNTAVAWTTLLATWTLVALSPLGCSGNDVDAELNEIIEMQSRNAFKLENVPSSFRIRATGPIEEVITDACFLSDGRQPECERPTLQSSSLNEEYPTVAVDAHKYFGVGAEGPEHFTNPQTRWGARFASRMATTAEGSNSYGKSFEIVISRLPELTGETLGEYEVDVTIHRYEIVPDDQCAGCVDFQIRQEWEKAGAPCKLLVKSRRPLAISIADPSVNDAEIREALGYPGVTEGELVCEDPFVSPNADSIVLEEFAFRTARGFGRKL